MLSKQNILKYISNLPGWTTSKKIVVIESDDWGSIRMSSLDSFEKLRQAGVNVDGGDSKRYNSNDTLATSEDLDALFNVLVRFNDKNGNYPVFTAISLTSNPDFERIAGSDFQEYHSELFTSTLEKYNRADAYEYWVQGAKEGLFVPELHGREHLNVTSWMRALKVRDEHTMLAFNHGVWGIRRTSKNAINYQAAFDVQYPGDELSQVDILKKAIDNFEVLHDRRARYFVPPNGPFSNHLLKTLQDGGIKFLSTAKIHNEPLGNGLYRKHFRVLGGVTGELCFITRNAFFEPNAEGDQYSLKNCLKDISIAFALRKPVVLSTHRANYIGSLNRNNRVNSLNQLSELLNSIIKLYPDVEFLTSTELGRLITLDSAS